MSAPISIVLADDHALVRESIGQWLASNKDFRVVANVADGDAALEAASEHRPDVLVLDIDMPGLGCFDIVRAVRAVAPQVRFVLLSALVQDQYIAQALAVKASAYISKGRPLSELASAIRAAAEGHVQFSPDVEARIVIDAKGPRLSEQTVTAGATLTDREREVLQHIARGMTQKEIAESMHISSDTVHSHTTRLMRKLQVRNRVELALYAVREGISKP